MSNLATHIIPSEFFAQYGGELLAGARVRCSTTSELSKFNLGLRTDGGWFTDQQVFFAEGIPKYDDTPDYFYIDADDPEPRLIRYFHLNPTDVGICAASLDRFVKGVWNIASNWGHHYFPHTTSVGLQSIIREAFAAVAKPDDSRISTSYGEEAESTVQFFQGRTWERLEPDELAACEGLSFLTPEAWQYFLPAFLLATVGDPSSSVAINTMIHLEGCSGKRNDAALSAFQRERWGRLSEEQVSVLRELCTWMNAVGS